MKNELRIFFTALMFYTRIPCPKWVDHDDAYIHKATRYFPLIGWIVGTCSALVYYTFAYLTNTVIASVFSIAAGILLTGAFHEDGFADVCDGFGGGWTKEKILIIMKDSRVGAYAVTGMILLLLAKFALLSSADVWRCCMMLLIAHPLSRLAATTMIFTLDYARDDESSKIKPVAQKISLSNFVVAAAFGLLPLLFFRNIWVFTVLIPLAMLQWYLGNYFKKWIGGYTGDCLGAVQQLSEILISLHLVVLWKFI